MRRIAIYGKGGIGKSTVTSHASAALVRQGLRVLQIGCDPKADSTILHGAGKLPTVLEELRAGRRPALDDIVREGRDGVLCVECGGPIPGSGCAGRGIVTAFEYLKDLNAYQILKPDVVLYDVLGDVVCGGFAMPMRGEYARNVLIVTSGEKMSLYAAANIALALDHFKSRGYARLSGFIENCRGVKDEDQLVRELAEENGTGVLAVLPRDSRIPEAEEKGMTAVAAYPGTDIDNRYEMLARAMLGASEDI